MNFGDRFPLRDYQKEVLDFLAERDNGGFIIAPTGAGKTLNILAAIEKLKYKRVLIVCTKSVQYNWENEIRKWGFTDNVLIIDKQKPSEREQLYKVNPTEVDETLPQFVIIRYGTLLRDTQYIKRKSSQFDTIVFDECHKLRNHKTKTFRECFRVCNVPHTKHKIFITATAQSRGPQNLWTVLNILAPHVFSSYWKFVNRYMVVRDGAFGKELVGVKKSTLPELQVLLKRYIYKVPESVVDEFIPGVLRQRLFCEMDLKTKKHYEQLRDIMLTELPDESVLLANSTLSVVTRLRQLLVCPKLIHEDLPYGQGLITIGEHSKSEEEIPHIVIFTPFKKAFPFIEEYLKRECKFQHISKISGGLDAQDVNVQIEQFEKANKDGKSSALLCTHAFSEGFNLPTPKICYHLGFDWRNELNEQADGRLRRGDKATKKHINSFYIIHKETVDTHVLDVLDSKKKTTNATFKD